MRASLLLVALALAVGFPASNAPAQPSDPTATQPPAETQQPQYVGPFRWSYSAVIRRGKAVRLAYQASDFKLERAVVASSRRSVRITLYGRTHPPRRPGSPFPQRWSSDVWRFP